MEEDGWREEGGERMEEGWRKDEGRIGWREEGGGEKKGANQFQTTNT
jgi:hypothetical protein